MAASTSTMDDQNEIERWSFREEIKKSFDALLKSEFPELEEKALMSASKKKEHGGSQIKAGTRAPNASRLGGLGLLELDRATGGMPDIHQMLYQAISQKMQSLLSNLQLTEQDAGELGIDRHEELQAGDNVGLLLCGIRRTNIQRRQVIKIFGVDIIFTALFKLSNVRPQFYLRAADVTRKVDLLESVKMVMRGDNVTTAFELTAPIVLEPDYAHTGLSFVLNKRSIKGRKAYETTTLSNAQLQ
ncbi:GTP binding Elongation factor Tu family protein [Artemisia annua]|uniref:GTP binding Elongation factor Tu family protein n=1 Tax=Artemisia annua TaxID=35608 RepID=A0A2U1ME15_ARTAN|nr:GTP binding Elongation factor Tu family protein [Artemisia annua]